jgi:two-component system response regulator AgrA
MNLYILEDEFIQREHLATFISNYLLEKAHPIEQVLAYDKTQNLIEALGNMPQNNLYFLDISIKGNHNAGLETAQLIRRLDPIGQISFITTHSEFAPLTYEYKVNAHDFIDKRLPEKEFYRRIITNIEDFFEINQLKPLNKIFTYQTRTNKIINVLYSDIYYFEPGALSHQIILNTKNETIAFYGSLTDIEKMSSCLLRVQRDVLVNQDRIKLYLKKEKMIVLDDDTEISVSRNAAKRLKSLRKW